MNSTVKSIGAAMEPSLSDPENSLDDADLAALGYKQKLHRTMGPFTSDRKSVV